MLETLQSLAAQTMPEWECIVVDDGSSDGSLDVVAEFAAKDARVRLMQRTREPKGACTCRNIAVENARGRYVLFLDTDDLLAPFCLEQRVTVLEAAPNLDFAIFPMLLFRETASAADRLWNIETTQDDLVRVLRQDPICQGTGSLWRRDAFVRLGMWDERLAIWQDIELHVRAFARGFRYEKRFDLVPDVYLRETNDSLSRGSFHSRAKLESRAVVVRRAVQLLREAGRTEQLREVRWLCASVALGAISSGNLDIARDLRRWAQHSEVLTPSEARHLRAVEGLRMTRLDRLPAVRRWRNQLAHSFSVPNTVGVVMYESAASHPVSQIINSATAAVR